MDFEQKKLSQDAEGELHARPLASMRPFTLIFAPAYVHLRANQKFVSIKGPLDFFVPAELEKLRGFENLYFDQSARAVEPFRAAGHKVRALLDGDSSSAHEPLAFSTPPFITSGLVLRELSTLWADSGDVSEAANLAVDPLPMVAFAFEICNIFSPKELTLARDLDVGLFESALLRSSWAVFAALHLGHLELGFLNRMRDRVFQASLQGLHLAGEDRSGPDLERLATLSFDAAFAGSVQGIQGLPRPIRGQDFRSSESADPSLMKKLDSRLQRVYALRHPARPEEAAHG